MTIKRLVVTLLLLLCAACQTSHVPMNQALPKDAAGAPIYTPGYNLTPMLNGARGEVVLALAFSGGGKRSAAFAYGALLGLRAMTVVDEGRSHPLLDDVDYIASVSGGSFPAIHYGLFRDKSFETFPADFLNRDLNAYIWGIYLFPWNWEWLINPLFGTNDAMAAVYDRLLFHGATYQDLIKQGLPMISVEATDIAGGVPFSFNQTSFDFLCSDLATFPVSRAVAASAGLPILFTPITLASHRSGCTAYPPPAAPPPDWRDRASTLSRASVLARNADRQMDPERTHFVHLLDGGVSDNLALRSLSNALVVLDENDETLRRLAATTRRVIVISVDGQATIDPTLGQQRIVSGLGRIISAVSGTQIDAYSFETLLLADQQVKHVTDKLRRIRCDQAPVINGHDCADVEGGLIQISLAAIADTTHRKRLQALPTSMTLPEADVYALVAEGKSMVENEPTLRKLLFGLAASPKAAMKPMPR